MEQLYKILYWLKRNNTSKSNLHLEEVNFPLTDFCFYIFYRIKAKHFGMAYHSVFLVESQRITSG